MTSGTSFAFITFVTLFALNTLNALLALCTSGTRCASLALGSYNNTEVCGLTVCICYNEFAVCIDNGRRNTNAVCTIHTDNFIKVDSLAIRERQHKLTFGIDISRSNANTIFSVGAILAVCTIFAVCTVLAVRTIDNTKVQHRAISKRNQQFIVF